MIFMVRILCNIVTCVAVKLLMYKKGVVTNFEDHALFNFMLNLGN